MASTRPSLLPSLAALAMLATLASCSESRGRTGGTTRVPSCSLAICATPCDCDQTFSCDQSCTCDPECGQCRAAEAECRNPTVFDGGTGGNDGSTNGGADASMIVDAGPCELPVSQGLSEPCCTSLGIDACGAGLFCAAFDGRTQPTCYAERSRQALETCGADNHCASELCSPTRSLCVSGPNERCTADVGCISQPGSRYGCDVRAIPPTCVFLGGNTGDFCIEPTDCDSGTCVDGTCLAPVGAFCSDGAECSSGACIRQECTCSPFVEATCPPGEHCMLLGIEEVACHTSGNGGLGTECTALEDCASPFFCAQLQEGQPARCERPCSAAEPCPNGVTCFMPLPEIPFGLCPPQP
ncbi:hypothetical protein L6R52_18175 [Myxococcota bacterium]|nr:hypothetical protein [Myxococcota bacterium]